MNPSLAPTPLFNFDHPEVAAFTDAHFSPAHSPREQAIKLYYAVRDLIRYDPYGISISVEGLSASRVLQNNSGWCVNKAVLLAAVCRRVGIPARLGYADVRNHLSTARLRQSMGSDIFRYHGYTTLYLDGKWVKATPAFNLSLCERFDLHPLEFDGTQDSIYHPFDLHGNQHMEYLKFHGEYDDVPLKDIQQAFETYYPSVNVLEGASFEADVAEETRSQ